MKICVVGSGGREHALANAFARQNHQVVVTPGNAGIPQSINSSPLDISADLFVIGPEQPLVDGLADELRAQGKLVFGPGANGAKLEGSKVWMKNLLRRARVPTADFLTIRTLADGMNYLQEIGWIAAIKTSGLAAGKGVTMVAGPEDEQMAREDIRAKLGGLYGRAGDELVIEEALDGEEVSLFAICNGYGYVLLEGARDYKRLLDSDMGPNTGGMGSYSPVGSEQRHEYWAEICIRPVLDELQRRGIDYRGVLYAGLMITDDGPKVLEFNIRFGDPEIQSIAPRIESDFAKLLQQAAAGEEMDSPVFSPWATTTVVLAAEGYPDNPRKGDVIEIRPRIVANEERHPFDPQITFAGVSWGMDESDQPRLVTAGGRVLAVTAQGVSIGNSARTAYERVAEIQWPGMQYRTDISALVVSDEAQAELKRILDDGE